MNATRPAQRAIWSSRNMTSSSTRPIVHCDRSLALRQEHHHKTQSFQQRCPFSTSSVRAKRGRPKNRSQYRSITAEEMKRINDARAANLTTYTPEEKESLKKLYTPEQIRSIELGEQAVDPQHVVTQGKVRMEQLGLKHGATMRSFTRIQPVIDKKESRLRGEHMDYDDIVADYPVVDEKVNEATKMIQGFSSMQLLPKFRFGQDNTSTPHIDGLVEKMHQSSLGESGEGSIDLNVLQKNPDELQRLRDNYRYQTNMIDDMPDVAPTMPMIRDPKVYYEKNENAEEEDDDTRTAAYKRVSNMTGLSMARLKALSPRQLYVRMVTNQTRMGKIHSSYVMCLAGDGNGLVGLGEGKGLEMEDARVNAQLNAIRNMRPIRRYENRTIYGSVRGKVGACEVILRPGPPGYGLRVSQYAFEIARAAGIQDLSMKTPRARNPMNICKAMIEALHSQPDPEEVARARGKKMVDVRKVYYAGLV